MLQEFYPVKLELGESESGRFVARGRFGLADKPTRNKRVYSRQLFEREIGKLREKMERRRLFGELDHPGDGRTKLSRVSHLITHLEVRDDGEVYGEAEILDTPNGRILKTLLEAGAEIGVSSRGDGSVRRRSDGNEDVGSDYTLRTFDFVADPSVKTAYPDVFVEEDEHRADDEGALLCEFDGVLAEEAERRAREMAVDLVEQERDLLRAELEESLRTEYEERMVAASVAARKIAQNEVASRLEEGAEAAVSRTVLQKVAELVVPFVADEDASALYGQLKEAEAKNAQLQRELDEAVRLAKQAGYRLYVEESISGHPLAGTVRSLMEDVGRGGEDLDAVKGRLDAILADLQPFVEEADRKDRETLERVESLVQERDRLQSQVEELRGDLASAESERAALQERVETLQSGLREATDELDRMYRETEALQEEAEQARAQLEEAAMAARKERAVHGHTNAGELRDLLEGVEDEDKIAEVVERYGRTTVSDESLEAMRRSLRRGKRRVVNEDVDGSTAGAPSGRETLLGYDIDELRKLGGQPLD